MSYNLQNGFSLVMFFDKKISSAIKKFIFFITSIADAEH